MSTFLTIAVSLMLIFMSYRYSRVCAQLREAVRPERSPADVAKIANLVEQNEKFFYQLADQKAAAESKFWNEVELSANLAVAEAENRQLRGTIDALTSRIAETKGGK